MDESYNCGHHVSKDICAPVSNEVCSGSKQREFWGRTCVQKNFSYCSLLLQTGNITTTVRDSPHYSNDLLQGGLKDRLLYFLYMAVMFAKACAVITNLTLKLFVYHFSLNTAATPFNFPIVM